MILGIVGTLSGHVMDIVSILWRVVFFLSYAVG